MTNTLIVATSLDGKIAKNSNHLTDWTSKEDKNFLYQKINQADCIVIGRTTYQLINKKFNLPYIVFTKQKLTSERKDVFYLNPQKTSFKEFVFNQGWQKILILGGAEVYTYFLEKNWIQEIFLTIEPIIFGQGLSIFYKDFFNCDFFLKDCKKLNKSGTIILHYISKRL